MKNTTSILIVLFLVIAIFLLVAFSVKHAPRLDGVPDHQIMPLDEPTFEIKNAKDNVFIDFRIEPTFEDLLDAIEWVESRGHAGAMGDNGKAVGAYQIHKIYVDDCNRILRLMGGTGHYTYEDRWDRDKSRFMTNIVTAHYARKDWKNKRFDMMGYLETAARTHKSPSKRNHKSTEKYWQKIKARLENVK